jgi:hypothetical protein
MEMVCREAENADKDSAYSAPKPFDWAEDVEATVKPTPIAFVTPANRAPQDLSALSSGVQNPWASLHFRHHRSYPRRFQVPPIAPQPPPLASSRVIETVRHPSGIAPSKPVVHTTSPVRQTMQHIPILSMQPATPITHIMPPNPIFTVHCQCGSIIPIHPIQHPLPDSSHFSRRYHLGFQRPLQRTLRPGRSHLRGGQM